MREWWTKTTEPALIKECYDCRGQRQDYEHSPTHTIKPTKHMMMTYKIGQGKVCRHISIKLPKDNDKMSLDERWFHTNSWQQVSKNSADVTK